MGAGFAVSGSYSSNKVNGDFASVREQSGIQAGDGGFGVDVKGHTDLKGAVIASTAGAEASGANHLTTGTLSVSDIENRSRYKATGINVSGGYSHGSDKGDDQGNPSASGQTPSTVNNGSKWAMQNFKTGNQGTAAGFSQKKGSDRSSTTSGISGGTVTITDAAGQQALTGKLAEDTLAALNRGVHTGDSADGLTKQWDGQKLHDQVAAGAAITATVSQQAHAVIAGYAQEKQEDFKRRLKTATPEQREQIEAERKQLRTDKEMLNVLVGAVTGFGAEALTQATIAKAADYMRDRMIESSKQFPGVTDGTTTISNISGQSVGVDGDGYKIGGTRLDLDGVCGRDSSRCKTNPDGSFALDKQGQVQFSGDGTYENLELFLSLPEGQKLRGLTGGIQGLPGTLKGIPYVPGSIQDRVIEYFAGPHDMIGGQWSGLYDAQGNARRGQSSAAAQFYSGWTVAAIPAAAPFAMAKGLPPGVWEAIQKLVLKK